MKRRKKMHVGKKVEVVRIHLKDIVKGVRKGMIGTVVQVLEAGDLLVSIPVVAEDGWTFLKYQVKEIENEKVS
jgi:hypothetical protein